VEWAGSLVKGGIDPIKVAEKKELIDRGPTAEYSYYARNQYEHV
jgi:hypothetical protein